MCRFSQLILIKFSKDDNPILQVGPRDHRVDLSNPPHRLSVFPPTRQLRPRGGDLGDANPPLFRLPCAASARLHCSRALEESARKLQAPADASSGLVTVS